MTLLLKRSSEGDVDARNQFMERIYPDLRRQAVKMLDGFRSHRHMTLQATEFVGEAWLRLVGYEPAAMSTKAEFYALYGTVMERVMLDYLKAKKRKKRGGDIEFVALDESAGIDTNRITDSHNLDVEATLQALARFRLIKPKQAQVFSYRYWDNFTNEQIGELLGISTRTVSRFLEEATSTIRWMVIGQGNESEESR